MEPLFSKAVLQCVVSSETCKGVDVEGGVHNVQANVDSVRNLWGTVAGNAIPTRVHKAWMIVISTCLYRTGSKLRPSEHLPLKLPGVMRMYLAF